MAFDGFRWSLNASDELCLYPRPHGAAQALDFEGPCLILERAERSLRERIDASAIDRATVPGYLKAICTALVHVH